MAEQAWVQLAIQIPVVIAFIWFAVEMQKRYQASMDRRDEAYLSAINRLADKIEKIDDRIMQHDAHVGARLTKDKT